MTTLDDIAKRRDRLEGMVALSAKVVLDIKDVAEITGYSKGYVYQLVSQQKIPFHKRGGAGTKAAVRFYESEINDWMKNGWGFSPAQDDIQSEAEKLVGGRR